MNILLVDNSKTQVAIMAQMVTELGYGKPQAFTDGAQAWNYITGRQPVELMLTGLEIAGMSGLELVWNTRTFEKTALSYIIVVTSSEDDSRYIEALDCGADDYLRKPLVRAVLWARLRAAQRVLRMQSDLNQLANHDPLTGALNRRAFSVAADIAIGNSERLATPLALLMLDIDHFKTVNDSHGHDIGDEALKALCAVAARDLPATATLGRLGGEEFAVLLPEVTPEEAIEIAENLRQAVAALRLPIPRGILQITASIGMTSLKWGDRIGDLLKRADRGLYEAKNTGRNRVVPMAA